MSPKDDVQFMGEEETSKPKRNGRRKSKPKKKEEEEVKTIDVNIEHRYEGVPEENPSENLILQPKGTAVATQEDPPEEPLQLSAIASTSEALQAILMAYSGEEPDEWDELISRSNEPPPPLRTERLTLGVGGYYHRDEEGKKQLYASEMIGIVIAFTEPRNDFLGDGSENLPPFCSSPDGVWGRVELPDDEDDREALLELAEDEDTPHPLLRVREHSGQDVREWEGKCKDCPRSKWRSANGESKGQACKQMRRLLFLQDGEDKTVAVHLPPTSIKIWDDFSDSLSNRRDRAYYFCRVKLGSRVESSGSYTWGKVTLENLGRISLKNENGEEDKAATLALAGAIADFRDAAQVELRAMAAKGEDYFV